MRLIDADPLYEKVQHDEELARNRVLYTNSTLPYPNNLNPSYTRYVAQMNERTQFKHMIADAPTIEARKRGRWMLGHRAGYGESLYWYIYCSECLCERDDDDHDKDTPYCPNCGAEMRRSTESKGESDGQ